MSVNFYEDLDEMRSRMGEWWHPDNLCWMPSERTPEDYEKDEANNG